MHGEYILIRLYDVARSINLDHITQIFAGTRFISNFSKKKGTPASINFPTPYFIELYMGNIMECATFSRLQIQAKIYDDGVISLILRADFANIELTNLHLFETMTIPFEGAELEFEEIIDKHFQSLLAKIDPAIEYGIYKLDHVEKESYSLYCIHDEIENPQDYLHEHENYLSSLLLGESPTTKLHPSQIASTMKNPFSFQQNDIVIFDWDRAIIIDANKDYEDLLWIVEIANYQQLELRVIDLLLDTRLDEVEDDIRKIFYDRKSLRKIKGKLHDLFPFRYDMIFIIENLENITKIIGDYYLAQVYKHLCDLFQLEQWSTSIHHRLDWFSEIFNMVKTDLNERVMLFLEGGLAFIFVMEFIFLLLGY